MHADYQTAMAAGRDAGNRHAQANGRKEWNAEDYDAACAVTNRLLILCGWKIAEDAGVGEWQP